MDWLDAFFQCEARGDISRIALILSGSASAIGLITAAYGLWRRIVQSQRHKQISRILRQEGENRAKSGEWERAIQIYGLAIQMNPNAAHAYYLRGLSYEQLGQLNRARSDWDKALQILPGYAEARARLESDRRGHLEAAE
jgi:tetratricopeptide (TPR) repeat protein